MSTPRINYNPLVLKELVNLKFFDLDPFMLLDIGVSGGIENHWTIFKDNLRAIGFDPAKDEIKKLNLENTNPNISYLNVGIRDLKRKWEPIYPRLSANQDHSIGTEITSIDKFCQDQDIDSVDFIKIDTDGYDLEAIQSAEETLQERKVLGLFVECQFHGSWQNPENTFANIDIELRKKGFSLFDLEHYRYTRSALPGKFKYPEFAQTETGQVIFSDALYIRDYASYNYSYKWGELSLVKQLKLLCIYELYGLYDCAVELLLEISKKNQLDQIRTDRLLNLLTKEHNSEFLHYTDLIMKFKDNPKHFYPDNPVFFHERAIRSK